jgi:endonuclease/exonuclease/phosphatase family metal-dependent hydrolase
LPLEDEFNEMIRVLSFNLRTAAADDGENRWEARRELAIERIRAARPDLAGLQEVHAELQLPDLAAGLPEFSLLGTERGGPGAAGREISAVLVCSAVFEVLSLRHFWLSKTPDEPGSRSWSSAYVRTAEFVHLRRRSDGQELIFANTHLDYIPWACREGARLLRRELEKLPESLPVILTGDFNAGKRSAAYRGLRGENGPRPLQDALRSLPHEGTFHAFGGLPLPQSIDWILASPDLEVREAGVDRTSRPPLYPSDHYPLWAVFEKR